MTGSRRHRPLSPAVLASVLLVSACGSGGSDSPVAEQGAATERTVPPAATPKSADAPAKGTYRVAPPDGRTSPTKDDWRFDNLALQQSPGEQRVSGKVDVTYTGPGVASMDFIASIKLTSVTESGPITDTFEMRGIVTALQADATRTVLLQSDAVANSAHQGPTSKRSVEESYTVTKVSDDDPKARAE